MTRKHRLIGLRWKALDLHVHTPASKDYTGPAITPAEFVDAALAKGLDGIAITDHNTGEWIDRVVEAAASTRLAVFPGVEITASSGEGGIHVIGLFARTATCKTVESLLAKLDIPPAGFGKLETVSPMNVLSVVEAIAHLGGLAVLAHADSTKGVLSDMRGQARLHVISNPLVAAAELCDFTKSARFVNGSDGEYKRKLAAYRASDNPNSSGAGHSADGLGSRFSWFKVDGITLDGLGQCFCDPDVRIVPDSVSPKCPDVMYPRILQLSVNAGFLSGAPFDFHEGLNSIIGGKGVGKSLVVEFLRFGLDQASSLEDIARDMRGKLEKQLGYGGTVSISIQVETGKTISVERVYDDGSNPISIAELETGRVIAANIRDLFPILAYSQTEALEIAKDPSAQLALIDGFLEKTAITRRMDEIRSALRSNDTRLAAALTSQEEHERYSRDAVTAAELVSQFDRALKSERHDELKRLAPKTEGLKELVEYIEAADDYVQNVLTDLEELQPPKLSSEMKTAKDVRKLHADAVALARELLRGAKELESKIARLSGRAQQVQTEWRATVEKKQRDYFEWAAKEGGDRSQLLKKRQEEDRNRQKAEKAAKLARTKMETLPTLRKLRTELLDELASLDLSLHELRAAKYNEISALSDHRLRLSVLRLSNRLRYFAELCELKRGSNIHDATVRDVTNSVLPRNFVNFIENANDAELSKASGISEKQSKRFVEFLSNLSDKKRLLALEYEELLTDDPQIQFKKDDGKYHNLSDLSIGQKCTALMIIALAEGTRPVLIDQPEDALDTPSVYEDVTRQLRRRKTHRQFVITTHNSTVAVAADSDQFHVLRATATEGSVATSGAVDRPLVVAAVIQHLEGGREPFSLRNKKYAVGRGASD